MARSNMNPDLSTPHTGTFISGLYFDGSSHPSSNKGRFSAPDSFEPGDQGSIGVNGNNGNRMRIDPDADHDDD